MKLYRSAERGERERLFRNTGERRLPKAGEYYLSGEPRQAWRAEQDINRIYAIATEVQRAPDWKEFGGKIFVDTGMEIEG